MKPLLSPLNAWSGVVVSFFAIAILSVIGSLFRTNHHSMMGSVNDPKDGKAAARTVFAAVLVYVVFLVFCGSQAYLHSRQRNPGNIALS